jgi:F-type H+-transporting ATPase subunit epsilon
MQVSVISAERSVFSGEAESVVAPAYDGLIGILPGHAPLITLLAEGEGGGIAEIVQSGRPIRLKVAGGFLQVASNVVRIVARRAEPAAS